MDTRTLSHFAALRFTRAFWDFPGEERRARARSLLAALGGGALGGDRATHCYQLYPTRQEADLLVWSAVEAQEPDVPARFFRAFATALAPFRRWVEPATTLWGLTRPSPYVRRESASAIRPLEPRRLPYLVVYPFTKTHAWYRLSEEERRRLMGEHIQVGRRYGDVTQLLLYSFGLQDQDFVVVYETPDLAVFSELVRDLRATEARLYTAADTPILTAIGGEPEEVAAAWAGSA
ncbi:MAG TPA: chlorite dismutase family protein [Thermoanaerobaculia bacterium]|nr:chlorite dismutase family protein [Thermoanaerobaculia bacterium]